MGCQEAGGGRERKRSIESRICLLVLLERAKRWWRMLDNRMRKLASEEELGRKKLVWGISGDLKVQAVEGAQQNIRFQLLGEKVAVDLLWDL
ncbi:hypothetical protein NDU88_000405 [Pleurodeles waltl]|uniref:Uncharacterized protein n=1 Tax=Pleurodeles waltl TaxID=8319 RepID=A0AAV7S568_PLEWA|nr:hypothetical protein NDU88_000405 [Pleurodeles waltl]